MRYLAFIILSLLLYSCTPTAPTTEEEAGENAAVVDSAAWVVQQAIARHGGPLLDSSTVQFVFRDRQYRPFSKPDRATEHQDHRPTKRRRLHT